MDEMPVSLSYVLGALQAHEVRQLPLGLFEYARLKIRIAELLGGSADVVNKKTLKPLLRDAILRDAVNVF
jgi:predicted nucleotidyltransferase